MPKGGHVVLIGLNFKVVFRKKKIQVRFLIVIWKIKLNFELFQSCPVRFAMSPRSPTSRTTSLRLIAGTCSFGNVSTFIIRT